MVIFIYFFMLLIRVIYMPSRLRHCDVSLFGEIYRILKEYVDLLRDELHRFNVKITEIRKGRVMFDLYYEWTHKNVSMHIFSDDIFFDDDGNIYFDSGRGINFDRAMFGIGESGRIPGSPATIKDLVNQAKAKIPWLIDRARWLDPDSWLDGKYILLGNKNNMLKVAHRLLVIATLKLSYTPIGLKRGGRVQRFDFNMPLLSAIV